jgi:UDP-N-acetylmuramoyl-tripeptide--D-alanyl-D-alanine ligase
VTVIVATVALTPELVAEATGGRFASARALGPAFTGVSTDTRTLAPGALFVALRGERFDGHAFVGEALARGARGILVEHPPEGHPDATVIVVGDTLTALQALAREVRWRSHARVVAITGSAGKTTTKEVTANLLARRWTVFRNRGNLNNHIGLPLSLIELCAGPQVAVVELGMNHAGEIRTLVDIARPDIRVWTNVGDAHIGYFGSRDAIAEAKAEILEAAVPETLVVANADDPLVMRHVARYAGQRMLFGEGAAADVRATEVRDAGFDGTSATVTSRGASLRLHVPLPGRVHLSNVLAGVAVALALEVPPDAIEDEVRQLRPVRRRGASARLPRGGRLVDDSYNASPAAVQAALAAMARTPVQGRRIAVLGEMLELGDRAFELHEQCGLAAAAAGVDYLVVIGGNAADGLVAGALTGGMSRASIHREADSAAAAALVAGLVQPDDLVLVKGSRGTRTDLVADRLLEVA